MIEGAELQQSVYVYKCSGCTVQVRGKCSNIVLDQCNKTGLVFDSVVAGVELVNCQSVQVQVRSYLLYLTILISTLSTHPCPGDRVCAHYLRGEDRRVPDVPEPGQSGGQHHLQQVKRNERHDPWGRGVRGGAGARAVHDHSVRHETRDQTCQPRAPQPAHILKYLYGTKQLTITTTQLLTT